MQNKIYLPILDTSQFWLRKKDYIPLEFNAENNTINTTFYFNTYWIYKYMIESQFKQTNSMYEQFGISGDGNMDEMKEMVLDTNPILFAVTAIVSLLHSLFEFLALKNGITLYEQNSKHIYRYCILEEHRITQRSFITNALGESYYRSIFLERYKINYNNRLSLYFIS